MGLYEYIVKDVKGNAISMSDYQGKVLLIVNTATGCGFTPQYEGLQKLYDKYHNKGFEVLDFLAISSQIKHPSEAEIQSFCQLKYGTTFPLFSKINVNGKNAEPLYTFLNKEKGGLLGSDIKWNFTKFLIDENGNVIKRYAPADKPENIEDDILNLLKK